MEVSSKTTALALIFGCASLPPMAAQAEMADPNATVEYSGELSILTKFGMQRLQPYFIEMAKKYEALHPDVSISLIQEDDDSVKGKTKTLVASNSLPDIFFSWTGTWGGNFVRGDRAVDLSPVIGPDTDWGKTFAPAAVSAFMYNDKYYGIPLYLDAKFMGYSKPIFDELGIDVPKSHAELIEACKTIDAAGYLPVSFGNKEPWTGLHYLGQLLAYNVPKTVLEADYDPATATFDDPGYVAALNQFREFQDACTIGADVNAISYKTAIQQFSDGVSAMYYQEIIEFDSSAKPTTKLTPDDFGFFVLPPAEDAAGDHMALEGAPEGYMISSASENIPLAIDFMKFVTKPENARILSAPPFGQPPAVQGGADSENMNPSVVEGLDDIAEASYLIQWLDTVNHPRVASEWLSSFQAFVGGTKSAEDVVADVRTATQSIRN